MNLEEKLESMVNHHYLYDARRQKILSFKIENDELIIVTDYRWYQFDCGKVLRILKRDFLPAPSEERKIVLASTANGTFKDLGKALATTINTLSEKPESVNLGQVKAMNDSIRTLVEVAKLELELNKLQRKDEI